MYRSARLRIAVTLAALGMLAAPLARPSVARAGGFEFSGTGTTGLGRGGAVAARADDGMALLYNPAMLADLPGAGDIMLNAGLAVWDACVTRTGGYGEDAAAFTPTPTIFADAAGNDSGWITDRFPTVCNSADPQIIPNLVGTIRLLPEVRLAIGLIAPNGVGQGRFGSPTSTVTTADGSLAPSPTRYLMAERNLLQFFPSVGIGVRLADWIRVGLTLQWGVAIVDFTNYTNTGLSTIAEDPSNDIRTRLNVVDPFIPAGILSVHIVPHRNVDVMFSGRISDSVGGVAPAEGSLTLTTGAYGAPGMAGGLTPTVSTINGVTLSSGQPFNFTLGLRYADRTRPRSYEHGPLGDLLPQVDDPLFGETFDIELDVSYMHLSQVTDFVVRNPMGAAVDVGGTRVPVPTTLPIVHGWSDALAFRLGGDYNVAPGVFAVRAGVSYEQPLNYDFVRYAQNDFMQGFQVGLHAGATLRIDHFDISLAYAHVFGETIVTGGAGNYRYVAAGAAGNMGMCPGATPVAYDPARPISSSGCYPTGFAEVVNNGTYTQEYNAVSLGLAYHFE